jgi:hypothetical protein
MSPEPFQRWGATTIVSNVNSKQAGQLTYVLDMLSWVKRSQKPNTLTCQYASRNTAALATYWLGEHIKNSVSDDLRIDADDMASLGETPDAIIHQ